MDIALVVVRVMLAAVFGVAGITKLVDLKRFQDTLADFGAPPWLVAPLGYSLPVVEIAVACLLILEQTIIWGAVGSLVILLGVVAAIGLNLARGHHPDCNCFGQLHSEPIGLSILLRNIALAVVAAGLVGQSLHRPAALSIVAAADMILAGHAALSVLFAILTLVVAAQTYLTLHLFRQNGRLLLRIEALESVTGGIPAPTAGARSGLPVGSRAPGFELPELRGGASSLDGLLKMGKPVLLVFSDATCGPCKALMPELLRWQAEHAHKLTFALITRGVSKENLGKQAHLEHIILQQKREVSDRYHAFGTPSAVLVSKDGFVAHALASGAAAIGALVQAAAGENLLAAPAARSAGAPPRSALPIGSQAPDLTLPDLSGKPTRLADSRGHQTILLFWNPGCGFCARMLPRLKLWELSRPKAAPQIVLISTGTAEQNRTIDLRSPVLLDQGQLSLRLFGAAGTPSALLIDDAGKIASGIAVGADAVFSLAQGVKSPQTSALGTAMVELRAGNLEEAHEGSN